MLVNRLFVKKSKKKKKKKKKKKMMMMMMMMMKKVSVFAICMVDQKIQGRRRS
jgi:hypothetical protein